VRIYSDIHSHLFFTPNIFINSFIHFLPTEYIQIFVRIFVGLRIYSDIRSYFWEAMNIFGYSFELEKSIRYSLA
jgi:hypothetical protein